MIGIPQLAIAFGLLGVMITLMGLFPGVTGITPSPGIGVVQFIIILTGYTLLILAALFYVKATFYLGRAANLAQQVGVRLALTGLVLAGLIGMADFLGFGSHPRAQGEVHFGTLQAGGVLVCLLIAALGVMLYAVTGDPPRNDHSTAPPERGEENNA